MLHKSQIFNAEQQYEIISVPVLTASVAKAFGRAPNGTKVRVACFAAGSLTLDRMDKLRTLHEARRRLPEDAWPVYRETGMHGGNFFLVETLPKGSTLASMRHDKTPLSHETLLPFALAAATVLETAHAAGLPHHQIGPDTIYLVADSWRRPLFLDLGEAALFPPHEGDPTDPFRYSPPERFGHFASDNAAASDLYSLGLVLYELATGSLPIQGDDLARVARSVYTAALEPAYNLVTDFPIMLGDIIARLLRKSPNDRYQTAAGLRADLVTCLELLKSQTPSQSFALGRSDRKRELNYRIELIGRRSEQDALLQGLGLASRGRGLFQIIAAPSGTGKTRLAREIIRAAVAAGFSHFTAKFSSFEGNVPLSAISRLIREHAATVRELPPKDRQAWQTRILQELGSRGQLLARRLDYCQDILPPFPPHPNLPREEEERVFFQTFAQYIALLDTSGRGTYLFIDDLHWCDAVSITLLKQLAILGQKQGLGPVHIICAYRSEEVAPDHPLAVQVLPQIPASRQITLGAFSESETGALVEALLDQKGAFVEEMKTFTHAHTGGVPFFIYQVLENALQNGVLAPDRSSESARGPVVWRFHKDRAQTLGAASDLDVLVAQRLKKLGRLELIILKTAAIAGASIPSAALFRIFNLLLQQEKLADADSLTTEELLRKGLTELRRERMITDLQDPIVFAHDRIIKAAYELLTEAKRRELHFDYAVYLSERLLRLESAAESRDIFEAAYHTLAGDPGRFPALAIKVLATAGARAIQLFTYRKANEYLAMAVHLMPKVPPPDPQDQKDWFSTVELYGDALSVEDIQKAIAVYRQLLTHIVDPYRRAAILGKISLNNLYLFRYGESMAAGLEGLQELRSNYVTSELKALLIIVRDLPRLALTVLWFYCFGKQTREPSKAYAAELDLLMNILVPGYFMKPLCAIANFIAPTCRLIFFKDSHFRALMFLYWAIATASLGLVGVARRCFDKAQEFLDREPNPVLQSFTYLVRGFLLETPLGHIDVARDYLHRCARLSEEIGESFWRILALQALIQTDHLGYGDGTSLAAAESMIELQAKINFEPTVMGCTLRVWQGVGRHDELARWDKRVHDAQTKFADEGFETVDAIYATISPAELLLASDRSEDALPLLESGFRMMLRHWHRVAYCCYAPVLLARALAHVGRPWRALLPLAVAWVNIALNVRFFWPQTVFATGEVLAAFGFKNLASRLMRRGVARAMREGWLGSAADMRLALGNFLIESDPESALVNLAIAKDHFYTVGYPYCVEQCRAASVRAEEEFAERFPKGPRKLLAALSPKGADAPDLKKRLETSAVIDMFLQLASVSSLDKLMQAALDAGTACTGADHGVIYLRSEEGWQPHSAKGFGALPSLSGVDLRGHIDVDFLTSVWNDLEVPKIRALRSPSLDSAAAMVVPLTYERQCFGLLYLGHRQIRELFTNQGLEVVTSLATQIAITLCNVQLLAKVQALNVGLERNLAEVEAEVMRRTRDIRSIFQAIEMGVLAILPDFSIHHEYSAHLTTILEIRELAGLNIVDVLFAGTSAGPEQLSLVRSALTSFMGELSFTFDLNREVLPTELVRRRRDDSQRILELQWNPVLGEEDVIEKVLLVIRDVTHLRQLVALAAERQAELTMVGELLAADSRNCHDFLAAAEHDLEELKTLITAAAAEAPLAATGRRPLLNTMFIKIHTLKGLARSHGLSLVSAAAHEVEQAYAELRDRGAVWDSTQLLADLIPVTRALKAYAHINSEVLKRDAQTTPVAVLDTGRLRRGLGALQQIDAAELTQTDRARLRVAESTLQDLLGEQTKQTVAQWFVGLAPLARDLGKPTPHLVLDLEPGLELPRATAAVLSGVMIHLIRNALDHGIETEERRVQQGKDPAGHLYLKLKREGGRLMLRFSDDGRGLNLAKLRASAADRGLVEANSCLLPQALAELIFAPGVSTATSVSEISGRGVGMDAVRALLLVKGGDIAVRVTGVQQDCAAFELEITAPPEETSVAELWGPQRRSA